MRDAVRAVLGGIAGTTVMSVVLLIGEVEARFQLGISQAIASYAGAPDQPLFGVLAFLAAGFFVWPLVFAAIEGHLRRLPVEDDPAVFGLVFSLPLWVLFVALAGRDVSGTIYLVYAGFTLFAHLAYGFTLGAVYAYLGEPRDRRRAAAQRP